MSICATLYTRGRSAIVGADIDYGNHNGTNYVVNDGVDAWFDHCTLEY